MSKPEKRSAFTLGRRDDTSPFGQTTIEVVQQDDESIVVRVYAGPPLAKNVERGGFHLLLSTEPGYQLSMCGYSGFGNQAAEPEFSHEVPLHYCPQGQPRKSIFVRRYLEQSEAESLCRSVDRDLPDIHEMVVVGMDDEGQAIAVYHDCEDHGSWFVEVAIIVWDQ